MSFYLEKRYAKLMVSHAMAKTPNECCGVLAGTNGRVNRLYQASNTEQNPERYSLDPGELFRILKEIDERNWELLGFYHSHTTSEAYPSSTDKELALWPDCLYFIVSLKDSGNPKIRAFLIDEGNVTEEPVEIVP